MSIILIAFILTGWTVAFRLYGAISIVSAGLLGMTAYSVPAVLGVYLPPTTSGLYLLPTTSAATLQLIAAWLAFVAGLLAAHPLYRSVAQRPKSPIREDDYARLHVAHAVLTVAAIALYVAISIVESPLYFLSPRATSNIVFGEGKLLWKWINAYGLLVAVTLRSRLGVTIFGALCAMHFLAGDRTMIAILSVALGIYLLSDRRLLDLLRPKFLLGSIIAALLTLLGKPIYLSVKGGTLLPLVSTLESRSPLRVLAYFEPFGIHNQLEVVVSTGFTYPFGNLITNAAAQLLVMPSLFGVDSSEFNVLFTQEFYSSIGFGLAFNYWAQGYAVGGTAGVIAFGVALAAALVCCQMVFIRSKSLIRITAVLIGSLIGVYIYRNSVENILAFVRQVLFVGMPLIILTELIWRRTRARSSRSVASPRLQGNGKPWSW